MWDFFQLKTVPSTFVRAGQRLTRKAEPTFEVLKSELRLEHVVHADETGWRIGTDSNWLWVFSSSQMTVYQIGGGRGHDVPLAMLGEDFSGVLACDGFPGRVSSRPACTNHFPRTERGAPLSPLNQRATIRCRT